MTKFDPWWTCLVCADRNTYRGGHGRWRLYAHLLGAHPLKFVRGCFG